ncbi:MAG: ATP phosphoribosyltransferase [Cytophagales bacterium]|nr:ATP phosphoribosyltransferase [Cytophagales bacterium]MDW8383475.1 ATP phosphoribosyltransferase [Flammeovirgaceae bacterium]
MENVLLRLALQKSGRLSEDSLNLISRCGIKMNNGLGTLKTSASNFPMEFLFLRDDDIPGYVADGVADIGIVGENVLFEKNKLVMEVHKLGFSKCRLSIAVPREVNYKGVSDLNGKRIATTYPRILQRFLDENGIEAKIHEISGSVEIAPNIGLADAICDIVSTGSTLFTNGLKEVETVFRSEAVLIGHPHLSETKQQILHKFLFRIKAHQTAQNNKYILLNAPKESLETIIKILPGMKSPTVTPLAQEGWVSVHSVIDENDFWDKIELLKDAGAQGILVIPIEKMII